MRLMGVVNMRLTKKPITMAMTMATRAASPMALKVFSRKAASALVSSVSLPSTHRRTCPTCCPSGPSTAAVTALSGLVGALDLEPRRPPAPEPSMLTRRDASSGMDEPVPMPGTGGSPIVASESSYRMRPSGSVTCMPISPVRIDDSAAVVMFSIVHWPSDSYPSESFCDTMRAISSMLARVYSENALPHTTVTTHTSTKTVMSEISAKDRAMREP